LSDADEPFAETLVFGFVEGSLDDFFVSGVSSFSSPSDE
jgi:hypothetical protein